MSSTVKRVTVFAPGRTRRQRVLYESELVALIQTGKARQLVVVRAPDGWTVQVLSTYSDEFMVLHSIRNKSVRYYRSLDRLIASLDRCGALPTTLLLGGATK
jgi:ribosomal protein L18